MTEWPGGAPLTAEHLAFIRKQMGFQSMQIRWESQRTGGWWSHHTRGRHALGAGVGTVGEALDHWLIVATRVPALNRHVDALHERAACTAGVLINRQAISDAAEEHGAWFQFGVTQMDDQQHALSALLYAGPTLGDAAAAERSDPATPAGGFGTAAPLRATRRTRRTRQPKRARSGHERDRRRIGDRGNRRRCPAAVAAASLDDRASDRRQCLRRRGGRSAAAAAARRTRHQPSDDQIAAGMLVVLWAVWQFFTWDPDEAPGAVVGGLVPGFFPLLFTPPLGVLLLAAGADHGMALPIAGALVVAALLAARRSRSATGRYGGDRVDRSSAASP